MCLYILVCWQAVQVLYQLEVSLHIDGQTYVLDICLKVGRFAGCAIFVWIHIFFFASVVEWKDGRVVLMC